MESNGNLPRESNLCGKRFFPQIPLPLFSSLVYTFHGERDLSSLPCLGGAAVQISLKREECYVAVGISWGMTQYWSRNLLLHKLDAHGTFQWKFKQTLKIFRPLIYDSTRFFYGYLDTMDILRSWIFGHHGYLEITDIRTSRIFGHHRYKDIMDIMDIQTSWKFGHYTVSP